MRLSVFGLGYVGSVTAACLAQQGHRIVGVDVNQAKVSLVNSGRSPVAERGLQDLLCDGVRAGRISATTDAKAAVLDSHLSLICVGTPAGPDGTQNLTYLRRVCEDIGAALAHKRERHLVVVRSTVFPGTTESVVIPTLNAKAAGAIGEDYDVAVNPEFLREGNSVDDFLNPPYVVVGTQDSQSGALLQELYSAVRAPLIMTDLRTAEMVKYACNAFHALKVVFANEVGHLCEAVGVDPLELMRIFVADTKLNLSPAYLRPGFAFGGSCLPKDLMAMLNRARRSGLTLPVLEAILPSNQAQIDGAVRAVLGTGKTRIGVIGLTFKAGTDDLRDSPVVKMVRQLLDRGLAVRVYDSLVDPPRLLGANREFVDSSLPELATILQPSMEAAVGPSEVIVVTQTPNPGGCDELRHLLREGSVVLDLAGLAELRELKGVRYMGACWGNRPGSEGQ